MIRTSLARLAWGMALLGLTSCGGADGGPVGTGISASLVGNVVDVSVRSDAATGTARSDDGAETLPPIEVRIDEVPDAVTHTNAEGNFQLAGEFAGALTVRFVTPEFEVSRELTVPAGSLVTLTDIELSPDDVEIQATRQLDFVAIVERAECESARLVVHDLGGAADAYEVALLAETEFVRSDGEAAACADIVAGVRIAIDGLMSPGAERRTTAVRVVIGRNRPAGSQAVRSVPFLGRAVAIDCAAGAIAIDDSQNRLRLRIVSSTIITRPNRTRIACTDIQLGDQVAGTGTLRVRRPGVIDASSLVVSRRTNPDVELRFVGFLTRIDCASGILDLLYQGTVSSLRLSPSTVITPPLTCDDLGLGDRVSGAGRVQPDDPDRIEASRLHVTRRAESSGGASIASASR